MCRVGHTDRRTGRPDERVLCDKIDVRAVSAVAAAAAACRKLLNTSVICRSTATATAPFIVTYLLLRVCVSASNALDMQRDRSSSTVCTPIVMSQQALST